MSSISNITNQLSNTPPCSSCNCSDINARLQRLESSDNSQESHLAKLDGRVSPLDSLIDNIRGKLGFKPDRGDLAYLDAIAREALNLARATAGEIAPLKYGLARVEQVLPIIDRTAREAGQKADSVYALAQRAYNLADATAAVTQHHTREIENLGIQVRSLEDRVARLEANRARDNNLESRVKSLEDWRIVTVGTLAYLGFQIVRIRIITEGLEASLDRLWSAFLADVGKSRIGKPGLNGKPGTAGKPGLNGKPGKDGKPGEKGKDAEVEFENVEVKKFDRCDGETPIFTTRSVSAIKGTQLLEQLKFEELANIEAEKCKERNCVATVPEWWQLRPEAQRPQAILLFREIRADNTLGSDYYPITIPHFNSSTPPATAPLATYEKGNFEGIVTLKDNSKLIVHCKDANECTRVIDILKAFINPDMLIGSTQKIGERKGQPFKQIKVKSFRLDYYPTGVKSMKPAYLKSYS